MTALRSATAQPALSQLKRTEPPRIDTHLVDMARSIEALADRLATSPQAHDRAAEALALQRKAADLLRQAATAVAASPELPKLDVRSLALLRLHSDHLTLIAGIDAQAAAMLNAFGIHRFSDIAAFKREDVLTLSKALGDRRRIARECWIEQAALLARGIATHHVRRRLRANASSSAR